MNPRSLKWKCCNFDDKIFITGCTGNCQKWQLPVQPVMKISSKRQHFHFIVEAQQQVFMLWVMSSDDVAVSFAKASASIFMLEFVLSLRCVEKQLVTCESFMNCYFQELLFHLSKCYYVKHLTEVWSHWYTVYFKQKRCLWIENICHDTYNFTSYWCTAYLK